jgi:serine/threonine protein kinase
MNIDPESLIGKVIGGYRLDCVLGQGLTGAVFQAAPIATPASGPDSSVAIKLFSPTTGSSEEHAALYHRFQREIEILKGLHHPNIL